MQMVDRPLIIRTTGKYVQGKNAYQNIGKHAKCFSDSYCILVDPFMMDIVRTVIEISLQEQEIAYHFVKFGGECCDEEIDRFEKVVRDTGMKAVMGVGGGKTLDTAKVVANRLSIPLISSPTSAATDAPCSGQAVIYTKEGAFDRYIFFDKNPDMVYLDTQVVANGPARLLVSGMGDALSTYYEAYATAMSHSANCVGGAVSYTARALAELTLELILSKGYEAKLACEQHVVTEALEQIVEANTYLSGSFESSNGATAHSVHNGLSQLEETHAYMHGEKVAFGVLVQLVLENRPYEEIRRIIDFCKKVGLPTCLKDIGVVDKVSEKLKLVARKAMDKGETIHNMHVPVDEARLYSAMLVADRLGTEA